MIPKSGSSRIEAVQDCLQWAKERLWQCQLEARQKFIPVGNPIRGLFVASDWPFFWLEYGCLHCVGFWYFWVETQVFSDLPPNELFEHFLREIGYTCFIAVHSRKICFHIYCCWILLIVPYISWVLVMRNLVVMEHVCNPSSLED